MDLERSLDEIAAARQPVREPNRSGRIWFLRVRGGCSLTRGLQNKRDNNQRNGGGRRDGGRRRERPERPERQDYPRDGVRKVARPCSSFPPLPFAAGRPAPSPIVVGSDRPERDPRH